ncbi:MAG: D-alanyl-D-alanine carboxypeptidase/D-alanyl-D-alanine-endopeptidase [Rhodospirillum sp.]|nr:D-alanyl-D-alanine carboxypeptidase/D-alanyl-D-alanine-endopeptidase [Rhodospirillum sp.]MCF8489170.1 D-alanyl-D-alanine carboxypeptidase/D-alanyl-D-alanine-endopeptidase [Rhodospirillum sp.]MCF8499837.1 D-alanyl-D-alanine carboxypeptidase/D-alanyl-D-alanine-endopeptidase [Rhodospirillum sp.]
MVFGIRLGWPLPPVRGRGGLGRILAVALILSCPGPAVSASDGAPLPPPAEKPQPSQPSAQARMARHGFAPEQVGFALRDLETGEWLALHNPDQPFLPASVAKVPTTVAALDLLGPTYRWETKLVATGPVKDGVLKGDLFLLGTGDPLLDAGRLKGLINALAAQGVTRVDGRFLYDETFLDHGPEIELNQPDTLAYNPGYGALTLDFNRVRLAWDPTNGPRMVEAFGVPPIPSVQFRISGPTDPPWDDLAIRLRQEPQRTNVVTAALTPVSVPKDTPGERWILAPDWKGEGTLWVPVKHPGAHAAQVAREMAHLKGIALPEPRPAPAPREARVLASTTSPPLFDVAERTLRYSNNLSAELIGLTTTRRLTGKPLTPADSAAYLTGLFERTIPGVDWSTFHMFNHSGLSAQSRATPRQIAAILDYAQGHAFSGLDYAALLPRRGWRDEDGAMPKDEDKPAIWAKTGTVYYGRGLAGYLVPKSGRLLAFVFLASDLDKRTQFDRENLHHDGRAVGQARAWLARARALEHDLVLSWLERE